MIENGSRRQAPAEFYAEQALMLQRMMLDRL
jgi:hypothetical protein